MRNYYLFILMFVTLISPVVYGGTTDVIFLNTGKMNVGTSTHSSKVALYIPQAYRDAGSVTSYISLTGYMKLGGNFYHDATSNSFLLDASGYNKSASSGHFIFSNSSGDTRYVTTKTVDINAFDRGNYYVSFPNVQLSTNDQLVLPPKMGVDATTLKRESGYNGTVLLKSDQINGYDYDASLRVTGAGTSPALVDLGSVIVEREVALYRTGTVMFPYASTFFNTQLSGYFAGNWVRHPHSDASYGSTTYVYGNRDVAPADGVIDDDQYIRYPTQALVPGEPYLIKPRPAGFDYTTLQALNGLSVTGATASLYDKQKFVFNGSVYTLPSYLEQLFAEDNLATKSAVGVPTSTVNWVIGNSYTCPISTSEIANLLVNNSGLTFSPTMYLYTAGAQSYQPMQISGSGSSIAVTNYTEIPSMSVFMVRLSKNTSQNGTLSIPKTVQRHGKYSHGSPDHVKAENTSESAVTDQINFRVTAKDNSNLYDLAAIGLRSNALRGTDSYDISKAYNPEPYNFQIYTEAVGGSKLAANGEPLDIDTVPLCFRPAKDIESYTIEASNVSTLSSEGAWLYDIKTNKTVDLKSEPVYSFTALESDPVNRFRVYFVQPVRTDNTNTGVTPPVQGWFDGNNLSITNLTDKDAGSRLRIYDVQGKLLFVSDLTNYPQFKLKNTYPQGVYVVEISGYRHTVLKVVKK